MAGGFVLISKDDVEWAWKQGQKVRGKDADVYRRDESGNELYKPSYGKNGEKSWEIDHRNPVAKGGTDHRRNLRILQSDENRK